MPAEGVCMMGHDEILRIEEVETIARVATRIGIRSVRLTGGEPLVRKGVVDLVEALHGMPGIENSSSPPRLTSGKRQAPRYAGSRPK